MGIGIGCGGFSERQAGTPAATPEGERERERLGERERSAEPQASVPVGIGDTPARPAGRDACRYTDQRNSLSSHAELQGNQSLSVAGFTHSKQRGASFVFMVMVGTVRRIDQRHDIDKDKQPPAYRCVAIQVYYLQAALSANLLGRRGREDCSSDLEML